MTRSETTGYHVVQMMDDQFLVQLDEENNTDDCFDKPTKTIISSSEPYLETEHLGYDAWNPEDIVYHNMDDVTS